MSFTPGPPTPDEETGLQVFSDTVDNLADVEPIPWRRRALNYPRFLALAIAQLVQQKIAPHGWDKFWESFWWPHQGGKK